MKIRNIFQLKNKSKKLSSCQDQFCRDKGASLANMTRKAQRLNTFVTFANISGFLSFAALTSTYLTANRTIALFFIRQQRQWFISHTMSLDPQRRLVAKPLRSQSFNDGNVELYSYHGPIRIFLVQHVQVDPSFFLGYGMSPFSNISGCDVCQDNNTAFDRMSLLLPYKNCTVELQRVDS